MNTIKQISLLILSAAALLFMPLMATAPTYALFEGAKDQACKGANLDDTKPCVDGEGAGKVDSTLATVINILSFVVGIIAVIMIIIGGIRFITSGGDSSSTASARNTIIYAVIGLVIVALAQFIVKFVIGKV